MDLNLISTIGSALLVLSSFVFSFYTYNKTLKHDRKQATLDTYNQLQLQALDNLNFYMPKQLK